MFSEVVLMWYPPQFRVDMGQLLAMLSLITRSLWQRKGTWSVTTYYLMHTGSKKPASIFSFCTTWNYTVSLTNTSYTPFSHAVTHSLTPSLYYRHSKYKNLYVIKSIYFLSMTISTSRYLHFKKLNIIAMTKQTL